MATTEHNTTSKGFQTDFRKWTSTAVQNWVKMQTTEWQLHRAGHTARNPSTTADG